MEEVAAELTALIQKINRTNVNTNLETGFTVADALAIRDILKQRQSIYRDLANAATVTLGRLTRSEVRYISTVSVAETRQTADRLAKEHRELDATLQAINWTTELLD